MKFWKFRAVYALLFLTSLFVSQALAQFEEDDEFQEEKAEENCIPENLTTPYDSVANKELQDDIRLVFNFGYEYYKNKNYKAALPYLWTVFIKDSSKYARSSIRKIAEIYFREGKADSTLIACYRGLKRYPEIMILHHYAGLLEEKSGKFRCAIPHYEKLVEKDSTNINYLKKLAFLYYKDDNEKAIKIQEKVVALAPNDAEQRDMLAELIDYFLGAGESLTNRKEIYLNNPDNVEYARDYAIAAVQNGKYEEALKPLALVLSKKPTDKDYLLRVEAYENLEQNAKAIADLKEVLKLKPDNADIMLRIANNYKLLNSFSKAKYWIGKALSVKAGYGKAYIVWGELIEASVPYCQDQKKGKRKYEDKLVYLEAYKIYEKAKRDPAYRSKAKTKQSYLQNLIPTEEDKFMHKGEKIKSSCYKWLK